MITNNIFSLGAEKLLMYPERIRDWQMNKAIIPVTLEIQPSEQCNHHCPSCQGKYILGAINALKRSRFGPNLDLSLLDSIWECPPEGIVISGNTGDPLMHPEIDRLLSELKAHFMPCVLITNGQLLTKQLSKLIVDTCQGIRISLDAFDHFSFKLTHGVGKNCWDKLMENIEKLVLTKNNNNSQCLIGLGFLTSRKTKAWMMPATELAKSLGVDYIQFRPYHFDTTNVLRTLKICESLEDDNFRVFSSFQKYSNLGECFRNGLESCQAAWFYTVLDARGDLYICCHNVGKKNAQVGSLTKESWKTFISSPRRHKIIRDFRDERCIPNCRLQTQNEILRNIANISPPSFNMSKEIMQHAAFL
jgi:radical SAM protein with 4Fe4S-binding SPASM domain